MVKGNCLNYLGSNKFDIGGPRLSTSTSIPKAVKRVHEIFEKPTFMKEVNSGDIKQGALGNCWFIASLSAMANTEEGVKRVCVEYDTRKFTYPSADLAKRISLTWMFTLRDWYIWIRLFP
jgi:hypothetical protein